MEGEKVTCSLQVDMYCIRLAVEMCLCKCFQMPVPIWNGCMTLSTIPGSRTLSPTMTGRQ